MKIGRGFLFGVLAGAVVPGIILAIVFWPGDGGKSYDVVAVLPFEVDMGDSTLVILSQGIGEQTATRLTSHKIKVIPWLTSRRFAETNLSLSDIAQELGADAIVLGDLENRDGDLTGTIEVRDAETGALIWSESFDRQIGDLGYLCRHFGDMYAPVIAKVLLGEEHPSPSRFHPEPGARISCHRALLA